LGPLLILLGMILLELLTFGSVGRDMGARVQKLVTRCGFWGAGLLGILFAMTFCPVSAALFFGSLIPLSFQHHSTVVLPVLYGLGTGLPILVFAVLLACGARSLGKAFQCLTRVEWWARRATGTAFVLLGVYYSLRFIYGFDW